ncbi:M3 family metallopeptidase [Microbulbifer elongatus]|uniref:M3 family metallopeptidase n=1 Tax=Microbulbifer elongatus TaxID=86173 RepID=UPI001CFE8EFC|nr:M3 family metallopeptidase [Microbulbifer elongatus]
MRKSLLAIAIGASLTIGACSDDKSTVQTESAEAASQAASTPEAETGAAKMAVASNPLMKPSPLQYQAPEFDKIKVEHYLPAFEAALQESVAEVQAIKENPAPATFDNTIVKLETSGELLTRVTGSFFNASALNSNEKIQELKSEIAPRLTEHMDNIFLDGALFSRVEKIYQQKSELGAEDQRLVDHYYKQFVRAGAKLSEDEKTQIRTINTELSTLSTEYSNNILGSFKNDVILVSDKEQLAGLSEDKISSLAAAAEEAGKQGYMISLVNTTRQPILGSLENRELRQQIWETSAHRLKDKNGALARRMAELRAEKAKVLGYSNWASYVIDERMAKEPAAVFKILGDLAPKAVERVAQETADIEAVIAREGGEFTVQPWDWAYYSEKVRSEKYDLDESEVKPYFELSRVLEDGLFFAMQKLYGITAKPRTDLPVWNPDVVVYEIFNADETPVGLFYLDPYAREGKNGGAWMNEIVTQSHLLKNKPVVYNALNIPKPAEGQPTLLSFGEVGTLFHEFGHAVHGLFSDVKYPSLAGTATPRDFVEFPSQFHEDWSIEPEVLANYARHYQTDEQIPQELLEKILKANKFNQGFDTTEYLAASLLDMEWHSIAPGTKIEDHEAFEKQALAKYGLDLQAVPPRYRSTYFSHIFSNSYYAGYYSYLWTEVFAADAFAYLQEEGGLSRENGDRYRNAILAVGNSTDLMEAYIDFREQEPSVDALLVRRGLLAK